MIAALVAAAAAGAADGQFEVALRGGGGIATGQYLAMNLEGSSDTPRVDRFVSLWAEAAARVSPVVGVGAYFQYAFGHVDTGPLSSTFCATASNCSPSGGHVLRIGGELRYRFSPDAFVAPWIGAGAGYVSHSSQVDITNGGLRVSLSARTSGLDLNAQAGADVRLTPLLSLGLYAAAFTGESASVEAGLRARFDL